MAEDEKTTFTAEEVRQGKFPSAIYGPIRYVEDPDGSRTLVTGVRESLSGSGKLVYYKNGRQQRGVWVGAPIEAQSHPGFLRPDGTRDGDGSQTRPDSIQGQPGRVRSWQGQSTERRFGGQPERPGSFQGQPTRFPLPGGGGHFGR